MFKHILASVAVVAVLVVGGQVAAAIPAFADNGAIQHHDPDNGYDPSIKIKCDNGRIEYLYEAGADASWHSDKCGSLGAKAVWLRVDEYLVCKTRDPYTPDPWDWRIKLRDSYSWNPIGPAFGENNYGCALKLKCTCRTLPGDDGMDPENVAYYGNRRYWDLVA